MNSQKITSWGCLFVLSLLAVSAVSADEKPDPKKKPAKIQVKITVDKATTHFTSPVDKDGFVDYAGALNALYSKGITPDTNAMVLLYMAFGPKPDGVEQPDEFFKLMGMKKPPANGNYFKSINHLYPKGVKANNEVWHKFFDEQGLSQERPWKKGELKLVEEWLAANEGPMKIIVKAVQRRHSYSPLVINKDNKGLSSGLVAVLLPGIQNSREFARALIARAMLHLGEGRTQQAWNDLVAIRKLGRLIGQGPTLIEALVGIAIENIGTNGTLHLIQETNPDAKQIVKYIAELDQIDKDYPLCRMSDKIDTAERAMYLDSVHMLARGSLDMQQLGGLVGGGDFGGLVQKYAAGLVEWDLVLRSGNVWYDRMVKVVSIEDFEQRKKEVSKIQAELKKLAAASSAPVTILRLLDPKNGRKAASEYIGNVMIALLLPAVQQTRVAEDRCVQTSRYLRIALGLSAYRKAHGKYPPQLAELKKYLGSVPADIFSKQPLTYKVTEDGYLVYSLGPNGKDENGRWYDSLPRGDDVNIRMPIPVED